MGISLVSRLLEFSLVFTARYETLKSLETNTVKKHKNGFTAIPVRIEFPHQRGLFIKTNKMYQFSFSNRRGGSLVWKRYVTLEIVNHHSIQPQTNKESVPLLSACQQGLMEVRVVFFPFDEGQGIGDELMLFLEVDLFKLDASTSNKHEVWH